MEIYTPLIKTCMTCNKVLRGRTDKKFCDDYCRNNHNNRLNAPATNFIRNINNALSKNRRIMESLVCLEDQSIKVSKERMLHSGFQFRYFTHAFTDKEGREFRFCYDHGYRILNEESILVIKTKEEI